MAANVLVRNDTLRSGGHYWSRTRLMAAPFAEMWLAFFDHARNPLDTASVALGLRAIFICVERQSRQRQRIPATPVSSSCAWRFKLTTRHPLITMFDAERCVGRSRLRRDYSFFDAMPRIPRFRIAVPFHVMIVTGNCCDPIITDTVNFLTREAIIVGVALIAFLHARRCIADAVVAEIREELERRRMWDITSPWTRRVSLEQFARDDPVALDHRLHEFLNLSDAGIRRYSRDAAILGLRLESCPEFLCIELYDYWS